MFSTGKLATGKPANPINLMDLSDRILSIEGSKTVAITGLIQKLAREGKEIIDLAVGEVGFDTPEPILKATTDALSQHRTRYGPVAGLRELKDQLATQFKGWGAENILVSNGAKQGLYMIFQCLCNPGDEVIIPEPYWVSFTEQVKLAGAKPVLVPTDRHQLDPAVVEAAVTPRTKLILINSPNNPTGAIYPQKSLKAIARLVARHNLMILSDEAYNEYVYDGCRYTSLFEFDEVRDRCIITRSFSKSFSMTGFRVGYLAAPREIIGALSSLQSHLSGNVCTFAQHGALEALALDPTVQEEWRSDMQRKRDMAYRTVSSMFKCVKPQGAFYLFPDVSDFLQKHETATQLAEKILTEVNVAVVPGEAFGVKNHLRISYGVPIEILKEGLQRLTTLKRP